MGFAFWKADLIPGRPIHSVGAGHREKRQSQSGGIHLGQMMGARALGAAEGKDGE